MGRMTSVPFAAGAIDLSALKPAAPAPARTSYVLEADDRTFESAVARSAQHPLVLEFWSPRAHGQQLSDDLAALANDAGGKYLLVRVNVDEARSVAGALGIQAVPMVVGVLAGQLVPLFQGTTARQTARAAIDQMLQVAVANGITGRATPVPVRQDAAAGPDPRFAAADAALEAGDFVRAVAEFERLLAANPADAEASAGRAQARLLLRLADADPAKAAARVRADPTDAEAQLALADVELGGGNVEGAFARLVELVRATSGDVREQVRLRLLELFETVGAADPAVLKARRDLMSALF